MCLCVCFPGTFEAHWAGRVCPSLCSERPARWNPGKHPFWAFLNPHCFSMVLNQFVNGGEKIKASKVFEHFKNRKTQVIKSAWCNSSKTSSMSHTKTCLVWAWPWIWCLGRIGNPDIISMHAFCFVISMQTHILSLGRTTLSSILSFVFVGEYWRKEVDFSGK